MKYKMTRKESGMKGGLSLKSKRRQEGIALPEIMIIISLVVILALLSYPKFETGLDKAGRDATLVASDALLKAMKMYQMDRKYRSFPPNESNALALWEYTSVTPLQSSYTAVTVRIRGTGACIEGVSSRLGTVGEEYHIANCVNVPDLNPGGYCCWKGHPSTVTDCNVAASSPYFTVPKWHECGSQL